MIHLNNVSYKDYEGSILKSLYCGDFKVLKYTNSLNILIEFVETGFRKICQTKEIKTGSIRDKSLPSVFNVGVLGDKYATKYKLPNGRYRNFKEYETWSGFLERCYSEKCQIKHPTYRGCTVSENFIQYTYFYEWCQEQFGFGNSGWHLDKDLLFKGNKLYSEYTCVFLPREINNLFTTRVRFRGDSPIGVHFSNGKGKYVAQISDGKSKGNRTHLGLFNDEYSAFCAYKEAKEIKIKEIAEKWKGKIDDRAYDALINYQVDITD